MSPIWALLWLCAEPALPPAETKTPVRPELAEDITAATGEVTLNQLLDEIFADVTVLLLELSPETSSPLALRNITLGRNIDPSFAPRLVAQLQAQLHSGTQLQLRECLECSATRTRIEGGEWVVTRGLTTGADARRVAESLGAKAFLDVSFAFDPEEGVLELSLSVVRGSDGTLLLAETFRADRSTPLILRASGAPQRREERLQDLEMLLEGRPVFGYAALAGFMILPHDSPQGDIGGATAGVRLYERFGRDRRIMFGLELNGFLNLERLAGGILSAGAWWIPFRPDLIWPEWRLGTKAGALVAGSEGNAAIFQLGAEAILRHRFGLFAYALFMTKAELAEGQLGGLGVSTGLSINW